MKLIKCEDVKKQKNPKILFKDVPVGSTFLCKHKDESLPNLSINIKLNDGNFLTLNSSNNIYYIKTWSDKQGTTWDILDIDRFGLAEDPNWEENK